MKTDSSILRRLIRMRCWFDPLILRFVPATSETPPSRTAIETTTPSDSSPRRDQPRDNDSGVCPSESWQGACPPSFPRSWAKCSRRTLRTRGWLPTVHAIACRLPAVH
jgi:hypothetical protein